VERSWKNEGATERKSWCLSTARSALTKPKPVLPVATGRRQRHMVRRGSTVRVRQRVLHKMPANGHVVSSARATRGYTAEPSLEPATQDAYHTAPRSFSTTTTTHSAHIPQEAAGSSRPYRAIPATPVSKDPVEHLCVRVVARGRPVAATERSGGEGIDRSCVRRGREERPGDDLRRSAVLAERRRGGLPDRVQPWGGDCVGHAAGLTGHTVVHLRTRFTCSRRSPRGCLARRPRSGSSCGQLER